MREAAGRCFVQVGLPYGPAGNLVTSEDYLKTAYHFMRIGGDCFYCAASLDIQKALCGQRGTGCAHVGLIPSQCTWTGGFQGRRQNGESARSVWDHVKRLEAIGCFGAELEVVSDGIAELITRNTPMIMLGMGAGPHADAQYLFSEDVLGHTRWPQAAPCQDLPQLRRRVMIGCSASVSPPIASHLGRTNGRLSEPQHVVPVTDEDLSTFRTALGL